MGDLQCPVRLYLVAAPDPAGCAERLRSARVAAVYAGRPGAAARAAQEVALLLQVGVSVLPGAARGEGPSEPAEQLRRALADLADRHRGEALLVVDDAETVAGALRGLVPGFGGADEGGGSGVVAVIEGDADGWRRLPPQA